MRTNLVFPLVVVLASITAQSFAATCPQPAQHTLADATRLLVVTTATWSDASATMRLFERATPTVSWRAVGPAKPAVVGKNGLGWGLPYRSAQQAGEPIKHEGDGKTPAGIFKLGKKFGFEASAEQNYIRLNDATACVDDLNSRYYNTIVEAGDGPGQVQQDWKSAEMMRTIGQYRVGFNVDYPSSAKETAGSCIFVHIWSAQGHGTSGCLASSEENIEALHAWVKDSTPAAVVFLPAAVLNSPTGSPRSSWLACLPGVK